MTAIEHIVAWIESSAPHYEKLLQLASRAPAERTIKAREAANLALSAYSEMVHGGDACASEHDASTILGAALALLAWKLEA